jgi:hypothetical protein
MQIIPGLARAGMTIGGGLLANKLAKAGTGPTSAEKPVLGNDLQAQQKSLASGTALTPQGSNLISMGSAGYQPVLNYWSKILSGNRGDMMSAMAPEVNRIAEGYSAATNASSALNPRGGPSSEFNAELPFAQQRDVTNVLQQARPQAAAGLLAGANQTTNAGTGIFNAANNAILSSTAAGRDILSNQEAIRKQQTENSKSIGAGLFDLINKYGPDVISLIHRGGLPPTSTTRQPVQLPGGTP